MGVQGSAPTDLQGMCDEAEEAGVPPRSENAARREALVPIRTTGENWLENVTPEYHAGIGRP